MATANAEPIAPPLILSLGLQYFVFLKVRTLSLSVVCLVTALNLSGEITDCGIPRLGSKDLYRSLNSVSLCIPLR